MRGTMFAALLAGGAMAAAGCGARADVPSAAGRPLSPSPELPVPHATRTVPVPPCAVTTGACASLSMRKAWLLQNGKVVYGPVPTEPGGPDMPTPAGTFAVAWKDAEHRSDEYGDDMPNSVFFASGGIAFHAGPLDRPSHGCLHLTLEDSKVFFDRLAVGAAVEVTA